jgi:hypothetical protein
MIAWRVNATVTLLAAHGVQTPTRLAKENALSPLRSANEVALIQDKDTGNRAWHQARTGKPFASLTTKQASVSLLSGAAGSGD